MSTPLILVSHVLCPYGQRERAHVEQLLKRVGGNVIEPRASQEAIAPTFDAS
jgi:hypothetical protein